MNVETLRYMQNLTALTEKYINRTLTKKERKKLKKLVLEKKENLTYFKQKLVERSQDQLYHDFDATAAFEMFEPILGSQKSKSHQIKKWLPYAASFVGVLAVLAMVFPSKKSIETDTTIAEAQEQILKEDKIILTLEDGTKKILDSNHNATVAVNNGTPIVKTTNYGLDYTPANKTTSTGHHKIYIPHGQKFNITLSDGTKVWLNSGSTLTFPSRFDKASSNRMVYLEGEAYFDVAEDKSFPFIVNVNDLNIKVLGTEFNVTAYGANNAITTTLIEGSVNLSDENQPNNTITLKPNQQGSFDKFNKELVSKKVDVSYFTAWMQNKIVFRGTPMQQILQNIERTYNVSIDNKNEVISNKRFTGEFDVEDIQTVFKVLSTSINFEYEIAQNKITIKK